MRKQKLQKKKHLKACVVIEIALLHWCGYPIQHMLQKGFQDFYYTLTYHTVLPSAVTPNHSTAGYTLATTFSHPVFGLKIGTQRVVYI